MLTGSQMEDGWGQKTLERLSVDLKNEFPKIKGFSVRNMQFMMQFYEEYNKELTLPKCYTPGIAKLPISQLNKNTETDIYPIAKSTISQLPTYNFELPVKHLSWTHNLVLIQKVKDVRARYWYMIQCIKSNWKVDYLKEVITRDDYGKHGALANNFAETLPSNEAREVSSMLKDPYVFDMLTFLLCKTKDKVKAEYALRDIIKPIGISDYELGQVLPNDFSGSLPTIEEIESEFEDSGNKEDEE
jgi:hypothetical protein